MKNKAWLVLLACGVLAILGLASVWGRPHSFDRLLMRCSLAQVAIVLSCCIAFWCCVLFQIYHAMKAWIREVRAKSKPPLVVIGVFAALSLLPQPAHAWTRLPSDVPGQHRTTSDKVAVQIEQPFSLLPDQQKQVDAAIAGVSKDAGDNPGFTTTIELAFGIFIAAVLVGTVLFIIVRKVCAGLDRMRNVLTNRLGKVKDFLINPGTNQPVLLGAALFNGGPAKTADMPPGLEIDLGFTASTEPATIIADLSNTETVTLDEFMAGFGVTNKLPQDSVVGTAITLTGNSYQVLEGGVTLSIESCTDLAANAWKRVLALSVPRGAVLDVSDLTGAAEARFWRVGVVP